MRVGRDMLGRRAFLLRMGGVAAAMTWVPAGLMAAETDAVITRPIPGTGERLPVIGMGTSRTFDAAGDPELVGGLTGVLQAFFRAGGALVDSSPMYGGAERVVGEILDRVGRPSALFSATKVWTQGREAGIRQMENSRRLWGVERFDLMQIHNLVDWSAHLETLKAWKAEGRVRYIGITTSHGRDHEELEALLASEPFDFVQLSYSLAEREVEERLLPLAAERGIAVITNRPFQRGSLFRRVRGVELPAWAGDFDCSSWAQFFLKFVVSHPAVTCTIPATSKVHHMVDNMGAGVGRLPDGNARERMVRLMASL